MPIFRSIRLYTLYTTTYGVQHCKRELCVSGWFHFTISITQHNEQHKMKPPTNAQFSFTALNTICSSTQHIQPNTPEDGHIDARNM